MTPTAILVITALAAAACARLAFHVGYVRGRRARDRELMRRACHLSQAHTDAMRDVLHGVPWAARLREATRR